HTVAVSIYPLPNESLYVVRKFLVELHPPRPASDEPACAAWAARPRRRTKPDSRRRVRVSRFEPRPLPKLKADSNANLIKTRFGILLRHFGECK
ncbi:hypothetical protein, partial [Burkholderia cenocepacia]|uniref:hypothetical protein n=1 Tax=Burkholderia cenocepacia TaxID=95486 RepID=UPI002AAF5AF7